MNAITLNSDRQIVIELSWLLSALTDEQKRELVDSLSCEDAIIQDVAAQLLDGWTEQGSHGRKSCGADSEPFSPLDKARRMLAMRAGDVALKEIEGLKRALCWAKANEQRYMDAYFACYHNWSNREHRSCPRPADVHHTDPMNYEVIKKETAS